MVDDIPVFQLQLDNVDILLSASDFYGLLVESDYTIQHDDKTGSSFLHHQESVYPCFFLDEYFDRLFIPESRNSINENTVAFLNRNENSMFAFILERPFEMNNCPVSSFRYIPYCLREHLRKLGVYALCFGPNNRIQYLVNTVACKNSVFHGVEQ